MSIYRDMSRINLLLDAARVVRIIAVALQSNNDICHLISLCKICSGKMCRSASNKRNSYDGVSALNTTCESIQEGTLVR